MRHRIPIYKAELDAGLSDSIAKASLSYASPIKLAVTPPANKDTILQTVATNMGQIDLYYFDSILASIGWNLNDDVFDKKEVWAGRATPEDKPINQEHNPRKVIGHIVGSYAIGESGDVISDNITIDELPDKYHLIANSVIYKFLKSLDENLEKEMEQLIAEIKEGKWYVSLEALFTNFDYAVKSSKDNTMKVIPRSEESAFLTKYLRAYGGKGVFENYTIGRLLRNITFSGKGIVEVPANPESVILNQVAAFHGTVASVKELSGYKLLSEEKIQESVSMADNNELATRIASLEASLKLASDRNTSLEGQLKELGQQQVQARISALEGEVKTREERIASLSAQVTTEQKARTDAESALKETQANLAKTNDEYKSLLTKQTKTVRASKWIDKTGASLEDATKQVEKFINLDDVTFEAVLETQPAKAAGTQTTQAGAGASPASAKNSHVDAAKNALNNTGVNNDAPLTNSGGNNTGVELARAGIGKLFSRRRSDVNKE